LAEKINPRAIAIVGGGAAGMFAAIGAAEKGANVQLFERNKQLGVKLLITGKGRCNITNTATVEDFIENFSEQGRFLYGALANLSNIDLINFLQGIGLATKEERGGRVFPLSDRSRDLVEVLCKYLLSLGVSVFYNHRVEDLYLESGKIAGIISGSNFFPASKVILTTGGLSYPRTGSTGDGYKFAAKLGHTVTNLSGSLVPLEIKEPWVKEVSGLSLKNVKITAWGRDKLAEQFGEMLFTHFGVSGPIILTISREVVKELEYSPVRLELNLKPALDRKTLEKRLLRDFQEFSNKHLKNAMVKLLPQKLIMPFLFSAGINANKTVNQLTSSERQQILKTLQSLNFSVTKARPISEAIVTSGGVLLTEVDPRTMASKIIPDLYFAGEVLDLDGYTGGYNLQAAFSTGYLAGQSAAISLSREDGS